ncbi:hypothetical protein [Lentzea atacamensis]|nr:hypothetical protein [Lentzea atacamensis]
MRWIYEGSEIGTYSTYDLAGAERYMAKVLEDPIAQDVRIVEADAE